MGSVDMRAVVTTVAAVMVNAIDSTADCCSTTKSFDWATVILGCNSELVTGAAAILCKHLSSGRLCTTRTVKRSTTNMLRIFDRGCSHTVLVIYYTDDRGGLSTY